MSRHPIYNNTVSALTREFSKLLRISTTTLFSFCVSKFYIKSFNISEIETNLLSLTLNILVDTKMILNSKHLSGLDNFTKSITKIYEKQYYNYVGIYVNLYMYIHAIPTSLNKYIIGILLRVWPPLILIKEKFYWLLKSKN